MSATNLWQSITGTLSRLTFNPALGWPVGGLIAAVMIGLAVAAVIVHVRRTRAQTTDETTASCVVRVLLCVTVAVMALTPSIVSTTTSQAVNATDVVVAVDVTGSMAVADAQYGSAESMTRLDAAKRAVADITSLYADASFMGLRFGGSAGTVDVPLTPDARAINTWANTLAVEATNVSGGSSLDAPLDALLVNLKSIRESRPNDAIILYLITDGEETGSTTRRSYSTLRKYLNDGFTVGVGSTAGGKIPVIRDGSAVDGSWVTDPDTGQPGISKLDETTLKNIADEISGTYVAMNANATMANGVSQQRSQQWQVTTTVKQRTRTTPIVWPLAIVAAVLFAAQIGMWIVQSRRLL